MSRPQKRYKSAPIMEAVIEIRVQPVESFTHERLKEISEPLRKDFPKQTEMHRVEMGLALHPDQPADVRTKQTPYGIRLAKENDSRILQIRRDGMAYSHIAPYSEWRSFRAEAYPLWQGYRKIAHEGEITRCGLRYINRVDIPAARIEIEDYFSLYPLIPPKMPNVDIDGMLLNLAMPQPDLGCRATVTQAMTAPAKEGHVSVILDIDLFRENIGKWPDSEVWAYFDKLRDRKNEIFESCITDRTRELIDK